MITEAVILGLFTLIATGLANAKAIYEVWCRFTETARKDKKEDKDITTGRLNEHIGRLEKQVDGQNSQINFLTREQLECTRQEERLWGHINLMYAYSQELKDDLLKAGISTRELPPPPSKRVSVLSGLDEFSARTAEASKRVKQVANDTVSKQKTEPPPPQKNETGGVV